MELVDPILPSFPKAETHYLKLASSESPYESRFGRMILDLLERLRHDTSASRLGVTKMLDELWRQYADGHDETLITVAIDYKDYAPLVDGSPLLHYRLAIPPSRDQQQNSLRAELRTHDVDAACAFVREAIMKCKGS